MLPALLILLFALGCNTTSNVSQSNKERIKNHTTVAILPVEVIILQRPRYAENFTSEEMEELKKYLSFGFQKQLYIFLEKKSRNFPYSAKLRDVMFTNKALEESNIKYDDIFLTNKNLLAKTLHVDALVSIRLIIKTQPGESGAESQLLYNLELRSILTDQTDLQNLQQFSSSKLIDTRPGNLGVKMANNKYEKVYLYISYTLEQLTRAYSNNFPYLKK
jgi:hypothetical protein